MIYLLLMLYSNVLVMGDDFVIVSIYWIIVHTVFKRWFGWPVCKGKKIAVLDFVALGILSTTWWFLYLAPHRISKKIFLPRMVHHLGDCAYSHSTVSTVSNVSTVRLCVTLSHATHSATHYATLSIIWSHKSSSSSVCRAGDRRW